MASSEGMSQGRPAKRFNISCDTVRKMRSYSGPRGYRRSAPALQMKLEAFILIIDGWMGIDPCLPRAGVETASTPSCTRLLSCDAEDMI